MAIQLIDTVTPDIGLKTVADKLNNNFTDPSHAASRLVGTGSGNVMEVGAGGLLSSGRSLVDANEQVKSSQFRAGGGAGSENYPGAPFRYMPILDLHRTDVNNVRMFFSGSQVMVRATSSETTVNDLYLLSQSDILSTTGQSTSYPMSQKATTDAINGISDVRDKTDVNEIGLGLEVIENINTFSFKLNKRDWYRQEEAKELIEVEEEDGKVTIQEKFNDEVLNAPLSDFEENDKSLKRDDVYTGFVAQDLKETLEALDLGHLGIVKNYAEEYEGGEDRFYIEHLALLPFLVNSVKQLSARVKELEDRQGGELI